MTCRSQSPGRNSVLILGASSLTEMMSPWIFFLGISMWRRRREHSPSTGDYEGVDRGLISRSAQST